MQKAKAFRPMLTRSRKTGNQSTAERGRVKVPKPLASHLREAPASWLSSQGRRGALPWEVGSSEQAPEPRGKEGS